MIVPFTSEECSVEAAELPDIEVVWHQNPDRPNGRLGSAFRPQEAAEARPKTENQAPLIPGDLGSSVPQCSVPGAPLPGRQARPSRNYIHLPARDSIQRWMWTDDGCKPREIALDNHLSSCLDLHCYHCMLVSLCRNRQHCNCAETSEAMRPRPLYYPLPASRPGHYTARENKDRQHPIPPYETLYVLVLHIAAQHSTATQHWRCGHRSRAVLSAHRSPSQHWNAWRAGSCNVPCESPGARLGSGSGLRWHATRCEAKSQADCASDLSCHARRRHRQKGSSEILDGPSFQQATVPVIGDSRHGRIMASLTSSRRKVKIIGGPPSGKGAEERGQSALAYLRCTKGAGEGPGRGTPSTAVLLQSRRIPSRWTAAALKAMEVSPGGRAITGLAGWLTG
ncbi:hypothetical protein LA080_001146 [Diaporthe eres]|nr:hypothetical protein LA080_001146 [Diaporthe eres]